MLLVGLSMQCFRFVLLCVCVSKENVAFQKHDIYIVFKQSVELSVSVFVPACACACGYMHIFALVCVM